jgi:hypothetical protein
MDIGHAGSWQRGSGCQSCSSGHSILGMATGRVQGGCDKNLSTATPVAPARGHTRGSKVAPAPVPAPAGFRVTCRFEQSGGEFDHEAMVN